MERHRFTSETLRIAVNRYLNGNPDNYRPIGTWDVSNVRDMSGLFMNLITEPEHNEAVAGITNWNVSRVKTMREMFKGCTSFNSPIDWDVDAEGKETGLGSLTDITEMFYGCSVFNQPVNWELSNDLKDVTYVFSGCSQFNQPVPWDMYNNQVEDFTGMFQGCTNYNQSITLDFVNVTNASYMFSGCTRFNQSLSEENNLHYCKNMSHMFDGCSSLNSSLDEIEVDDATDMSYMFRGCTSFNMPLSSWNVGYVENMSYMFSGCTMFNQPLTTWRTLHLTNMSHMFDGCISFNQDLSGFYVRLVTNHEHAFDNTPIEYNIARQPQFRQVRNPQPPQLRQPTPLQHPRQPPQAQPPVLINYSSVEATPIPIENVDTSILTGSVFDFIGLENYSISEYLEKTKGENPDDTPIIFKQGDNFTALTRSVINRIMQSSANSLIKYECKQEYTIDVLINTNERVELVEPLIPYFSNRHIGLYGLTPLSQIKYVMEHPEIMFVSLVEPYNILATASYGVITRRTDLTSASHCQRGSNETVYNMIDITSSVNEMLPSSSTKKIETIKGGRKHKKTKKSTVRKTMKKRRRKSKTHKRRRIPSSSR